MKKLPGFKAHAAAVKDIEAQVARLMGKRFVAATPFERLQHYPALPEGAALRLDKLKADPARDSRLMAEYARCGPTTSAAPASWRNRAWSTRIWSSSAGCWRSCAFRCSRRN